MKTTKSKKMTIGLQAELNGLSALELGRTYGSDGPLLYWLKKLDDRRPTDMDFVFGISKQYLDFMVRLFLAAHLASSKFIEDRREGLPGDRVKLVPTAPNHPTRKFRVIQLWDRERRPIVNADDEPEEDETVLTRFLNQDARASSRRRWPKRRPSPLRVDLVAEVRKVEEDYNKHRDEVRQYRAHRPEWEQGQDDGLDPLPGETMQAYRNRVRPVLHQKW